MGFLRSFLRSLFKAFCGTSPQQEAPEPVYSGAGESPSPYTQQIQQPGGYSAPYQYPPPQQQWRPPQQPPKPAYSQQHQHPERPRPHKPHHGHGHGQSQGPPQGLSPVLSPQPPAAAQNQWTSSWPQPQSQAVHPTSSPPPHGQHVRPYLLLPSLSVKRMQRLEGGVGLLT